MKMKKKLEIEEFRNVKSEMLKKSKKKSVCEIPLMAD